MDIEFTKMSTRGYEGFYDQSFDPAIKYLRRKKAHVELARKLLHLAQKSTLPVLSITDINYALLKSHYNYHRTEKHLKITFSCINRWKEMGERLFL